jgi:hypothetical protein
MAPAADIMKPNDDQPKPVQPANRLFFFGIAAFIIITILLNFGNMDSSRVTSDCLAKVDNPADKSLTALKRAKKVAACLNERSGLLAQLQLRSMMSMMESLVNAPCNFVGVWTWVRPAGIYRITLRDDGEFTAEPAKDSVAAESDSGSWAVSDKRMVWFHNSGPIWPPDITLVDKQTDKSFTLVERDGARTQFDLIEATKSQTCPQR